MPKVRISHFVTKNIPITPEITSTCKGQIESSSITTIPEVVELKKESSRVSVKRKEVIQASKEATFASIPVKKRSKVIEEEVLKEVKRFRSIPSTTKRRRITLQNV